jgi:hypothetical protein
MPRWNDMPRYNVYIDQVRWGSFDSPKSKEEFQKEMQEQLKHLHPLNMSEKGAIEYRKRYENSIVYVYGAYDEVTHIKEDE